MDREAVQVGERGVAGAEIIDRKLNTECTQALQDVDNVLGMLHRHALGNLELEKLSGQLGVGQSDTNGLEQIEIVELTGGEINGDANRSQTARLPGHRLLARLAQGPHAHWHNESGVLKQRDKLPRRDQSCLRVIPANQRLSAGDAAAAQFDLRLVVQDKLLALERVAQLRLKRQALERLGVHIGRVKLVAITTLALGAREGDIGIGGDARHVLAIVRAETDPGAGGEKDFLAIEREGL